MRRLRRRAAAASVVVVGRSHQPASQNQRRTTKQGRERERAAPEGCGGLRSGPAHNPAFAPALAVVEAGELVEGLEGLVRAREGWVGEPRLLVRAARHYEGAVQALVRQTVPGNFYGIYLCLLFRRGIVSISVLHWHGKSERPPIRYFSRRGGASEAVYYYSTITITLYYIIAPAS